MRLIEYALLMVYLVAIFFSSVYVMGVMARSL